MNTANTAAEIIRDQLGGGALMMLGAKDILGSENALQFAIRGSRKVSKIRITLDPSDTYTVEFFKKNGRFDYATVATVEGVYVDSLHAVIETNTGLYTSL